MIWKRITGFAIVTLFLFALWAIGVEVQFGRNVREGLPPIQVVE